jgi:competence ComEA-like helix-hairpin-helix protein
LGYLRVWQKEQFPELLPGNLDSLDQVFTLKGGELRQSTAVPSKQVTFPVDLNTATEIELIQLPGIGITRAKAIIDLRVNSGSFSSSEELLLVRGIGKATLQKLQNLVCVKKVKKDSLSHIEQSNSVPKKELRVFP